MIDEDRSTWTLGQLADEVIEACDLPMGCRGTIIGALEDAKAQGAAYAGRVRDAAINLLDGASEVQDNGLRYVTPDDLERLRAALHATSTKVMDRAVISPREAAKDRAAMELTAALVRRDPDYHTPGHETEYLERDAVMELVTAWRMKWDAAGKLQSSSSQGGSRLRDAAITLIDSSSESFADGTRLVPASALLALTQALHADEGHEIGQCPACGAPAGAICKKPDCAMLKSTPAIGGISKENT